MRYIAIPDVPYSSASLEEVLIAITKLKTPEGLHIAVFPRIIEFVIEPFILDPNL